MTVSNGAGVAGGRGSRPTSTHSHSDLERTDGEGEVEGEGEEDDGEESDPEDSERPWTCHLVQSAEGFPSSVRRSRSASPIPPNPPSPTSIKRIHLGTLIPAPHHPKLVATLSVPFALAPLPLGTPTAGGTWGAREGLSVEEMKDCLSATCLWVVVREGLGGLAGASQGKAGAGRRKEWKLGGR